MSEKIKRFIDCVLPVTTCNLNCHYCCITINRQNKMKLPDLKSQSELIGQALSKKKLGGTCIINICGFGETLLIPETTKFIENLLKEGHYVMVVTNGVVTKRFEEIVDIDKNLLKRLFFKFSFHYLELRRTNQLDKFFKHIQMIKDAGCSYSVEMTPNDEIIPHIDDIKKICMEKLGALCHLTVTRDGTKKDLPLLTKQTPKEYEQTWGQFDSKMFKYKLSTFGKKVKDFCYAGDWTLFLNLSTGELKQCYKGEIICPNIYQNIETPFNFKAIGYKCQEPHCYNAHAFLTFGVVPTIKTPTYFDMRNKKDKMGNNWVTSEFYDCFTQKLSNTNKKYSALKLMEINMKNIMRTKIVQNTLSVINENNHKVVTICGIRFKFKLNKNKCELDKFSQKYKKELKNARILLQDKESKRIFDARIKYLDSYDIEKDKIPQSNYEEYHHPNVSVNQGDVLIDAGVSEWLEPTIVFSKKVGATGKILGFEPEPICYKEAIRQINELNLNNVEIAEVGLWNKDDILKITQSGRGSSFFWESPDKTKISCKLISLDKYLSEHNVIKRIDFIKMDIEGAEINALKGALDTIIKNRPKLAICVYHKPEHLFEIIFFLNSLKLGYKFYLGHHRNNEFSTVLYAISKKRGI